MLVGAGASSQTRRRPCDDRRDHRGPTRRSSRRRSAISATSRGARSSCSRAPTSSTARTPATRARSSAPTTSPSADASARCTNTTRRSTVRARSSRGSPRSDRRADQRRRHAGHQRPRRRVVAAVAAAGLRGDDRARTHRRSSRRSRSADWPPIDSSWRASCRERRASARSSTMQWRREPRTIVFYESPQRLRDHAGRDGSAILGERRVAVAREITKLHEEVLRGTRRRRRARSSPLARCSARSSSSSRARHDVAIGERRTSSRAALRDAARRAGRRSATPSPTVAATLGVSHRDAYQLALDLRADDAA